MLKGKFIFFHTVGIAHQGPGQAANQDLSFGPDVMGTGAEQCLGGQFDRHLRGPGRKPCLRRRHEGFKQASDFTGHAPGQRQNPKGRGG